MSASKTMRSTKILVLESFRLYGIDTLNIHSNLFACITTLCLTMYIHTFNNSFIHTRHSDFVLYEVCLQRPVRLFQNHTPIIKDRLLEQMGRLRTIVIVDCNIS